MFVKSICQWQNNSAARTVVATLIQTMLTVLDKVTIVSSNTTGLFPDSENSWGCDKRVQDAFRGMPYLHSLS